MFLRKNMSSRNLKKVITKLPYCSKITNKKTIISSRDFVELSECVELEKFVVTLKIVGSEDLRQISELFHFWIVKIKDEKFDKKYAYVAQKGVGYSSFVGLCQMLHFNIKKWLKDLDEDTRKLLTAEQINFLRREKHPVFILRNSDGVEVNHCQILY